MTEIPQEIFDFQSRINTEIEGKDIENRIDVKDYLELFKSKLIGKNISQTIFNKDKSKITSVFFGAHTKKFLINNEAGQCFLLTPVETYILSHVGGLELEDTKNRIQLYLLK